MAYKVAYQDGNWSTAATWNSLSNTPTLHATTNITISSSNLYSAVFTAPNLVNASTGAMIYLTAIGTAGTITLQLQEYSGAAWGDCAGATVSITVASLANRSSSWVYFKWGTPYTYTTTTAGYYRIRAVNATPSGTTSFAADSGGSNFAYFATDSRTGVPGTTDDIWIAYDGTSTITVTMDGTQTIGSGASTTAAMSNQRALTNAINLSNGGCLTWDNSASSTLTCTGNFIVYAGGSWVMDYSSDQTKVGTLTMVEPNACDYGYAIFNYAGLVSLKGAPKTSTTLYRTHYASGSGTAASPLVVADAVDWIVGDEVVIAASSDNVTNWNETESRYIITKNSSTSYVLSNTKGGAENALTYTHNTNAIVANITRNVVLNTNTTSNGLYLTNNNASGTAGYMEWIRVDTIATGSTAPKYCFAVHGSQSPYSNSSFNYNVGTNRRGSYGFLIYGSKVPRTYTGNIFYNDTLGAAGYCIGMNGVANCDFNDFLLLKISRTAIYWSCSSSTLNRAIVISANTVGSSSYPPVWLVTATDCTFNDCEIHASRYAFFINITSGLTVRNALIGTKGNNTLADIYAGKDYSGDVLFTNCTFTGTTLISNYTNLSYGFIRFHRQNLTDMNNFWYTNFGSAQCCGSGLSDTTVRTSGTYSVRLSPESLSPGFRYSFYVLARSGYAVSSLGFLMKNAAYGSDDLIVELFLPGSVTADDTQTMPNNTDWNVFNVAATYSGAVNGLAEVRITAKSATVGAYAYLADIFNGTNDITNLKTWDKGQPSPIMFEQLGDAAAIWAVDTSTLNVPGTTGLKLKQGLTAGQFVALK